MDQILYWNEVALEANKINHTTFADKGALGPCLSARALAMIHLAMYEVVAEISNKFKVYYTNKPIGFPPPPKFISPNNLAPINAAIASAAQSTLSFLYPSLKSFFDSKHKAANISPDRYNEGHYYGLQIANLVIADRKNDFGVSDDGYSQYIGRYSHRKDPNNPDQPIDGPFYGSRTKLFSASQRFPLQSPRNFNPAYLNRSLIRVIGKGISPDLMGTLDNNNYIKRTSEEGLIGTYWAYDGAKEIGTPPRMYNQIIRKIAIHKCNSQDQNAQLFALVNIAMADAGILAWDEKYIHNYWRPIIAIREWDNSMGYQGSSGQLFNQDCHPSWLPMGAPNTNSVGKKDFTPPFPAYPSGHASFGAAALHMTRLFFGGSNYIGNIEGDKFFENLSFVSDELNGQTIDCNGSLRPKHTREFKDGLWQMIIENGLSRVYLGIHWDFDSFDVDDNGNPRLKDDNGNYIMIGGVPLGLRVAEDIYKSWSIE